MNRLITSCSRLIRLLESVSYDTLIAIPARVFPAVTFWLSGRTKVDGLLRVSDSTVFLFQHEYDIPLIPFRIAAYLTTYAEHLLPILLLVGLASRLSAAAVFVMTAIIQIFVYPGAWATHLGWSAALMFLVFRGPGQLSIDALIRRVCLPEPEHRRG